MNVKRFWGQVLPFLAFAFGSAAFAQSDAVRELVRKGIEQHDQGQYTLALKSYEAAIAMDKKAAVAYYEMAVTYMALQDYKKAIKNTEKVIKINNGYVDEAYMLSGNAYDNMGQPEKSLKLYGKALARNPDNHMIYFNRALTYLKMGQTEEAREDAMQSISLNPTHPTGHYLLGTLEADAKRRLESVACLIWFLTLEPQGNRAERVNELLQDQLHEGLSKEGNTINISIFGLSDEAKNPWKTGDMFYGLSAAAIYKDLDSAGAVNPHFESDGLFAAALSSMVMAKEKEDDPAEPYFWDVIYLPFYQAVEEAELTMALGRFINQVTDPTAWEEYKADNPEKVDALAALYGQFFVRES